jgi:glucose 1-dehydrogenase
VIDVLVNNAGINIPRDMLEISEGDWDRLLNVNLKGAYFMLQAVAKHMLNSGKAGSIINVASMTGRIPRPSQLAYGASKAAIIYLTRTAAEGLGPWGIRVNAVAPAAIDSPMLRAAGPTAGPAEGMTAENWLASRSKRIPLGRIATARDVANASLFLASDEAGFVSGAIPGVCGGLAID